MPLKDLQELAVKGKIKNRVISWRLLLKVLSGRHDTIIQQSWTMRHQYYQLKEKLEPKSAVGMDTSVFNPLSQHPENPWNVHFKNQEARKNIRLDVDRTFQKIEFFRVEEHKKVLENILFVWSMEHDIGYRQGMNEIVAVIVYYAITEEETLDSLSSREHVEPDSYYIFDKIMEKGLQELYTNKDLSKMSLDTFNEIPSLDRSNEKEMSFSIRKCHYIFHRILSNVDYELYYHINKQKFEPQLFLLRWVRCMLSREFSLDEIVYVWDAIFSFTNENELDLLNYLCVGILVKSRDLCKIYAVLANHQSNLLQIIMKPLHIYDVQELINLAVGYLVDKVDKRIVPPPGVKEETGLIQKIMNLVVEKIGPTPTAVIKTQNNSEALLQALENINKVISITEKSIGLKSFDVQEINIAAQYLRKTLVILYNNN